MASNGNRSFGTVHRVTCRVRGRQMSPGVLSTPLGRPALHACTQVGERERKQEYEHLFKDVAGVLVEKCVNPNTNRPYTLSMLERALRDIHFNLDPKKSAKQQALEVRASLHACIGV